MVEHSKSAMLFKKFKLYPLKKVWYFFVSEKIFKIQEKVKVKCFKINFKLVLQNNDLDKNYAVWLECVKK